MLNLTHHFSLVKTPFNLAKLQRRKSPLSRTDWPSLAYPQRNRWLGCAFLMVYPIFLILHKHNPPPPPADRPGQALISIHTPRSKTRFLASSNLFFWLRKFFMQAFLFLLFLKPDEITFFFWMNAWLCAFNVCASKKTIGNLTRNNFKSRTTPPHLAHLAQHVVI